MKSANVVMLPAFLCTFTFLNLEAIAESDSKPGSQTVAVRLDDPEHPEIADIRALGESIRREIPVPFKDGLNYFFSEVQKVCLADGASTELRQAYLEEARNIYLYTGYKHSESHEGAQAFQATHFHSGDQPREVVFGGERTAQEIFPAIDGLSDLLIAESLASRLRGFRSEDILGSYGVGADLYNRLQNSSQSTDMAANRRVFQFFGEELAKAADKSIAVEKLVKLPSEPSLTLLMRLALIDYFDQRFSDIDIGKKGKSAEVVEIDRQSAAALAYGMTMLLGVEGDDRYNAVVYAYLAMGPGYHNGHFDQLFAYTHSLPYDRETSDAPATNANTVVRQLRLVISKLESAGWSSPRLQAIKQKLPAIAARIEKGAAIVSAPPRNDKFAVHRLDQSMRLWSSR